MCLKMICKNNIKMTSKDLLFKKNVELTMKNVELTMKNE